MSGTIKVTIEQATVADFRRVETKTGRPMARFRAEVGKDRLAVIVFNELAERLDLAAGDTVVNFSPLYTVDELAHQVAARVGHGRRGGVGLEAGFGH